MSEIKVNTINTRTDTSLSIQQNSTTAMTINSSGYVGIGTAAPAEELHVNSSTGSNILARFSSSDDTASIALSDNGGSVLLQTKNSGDFVVQTGGTGGSSGASASEAMRIDSSGNIGLGKTSPSVRLDIEGSSNTTSRARITKTGSGTLQLSAHSDGIPNPYVGSESNHNFSLISNGTEKVVVETGNWVKGIPMCFQGEHSGAVSIGHKFSFGNGATDSEGVTMIFDGKIIGASVSKTSGSDAGTFRLIINGTENTNADITTGTGTSSNYLTSLDISFSAGDRINWTCTDGADTTTVLAFWVIFTP